MIYYTGGLILSNIVPQEKTLTITISSESGIPLKENLPLILKEYTKYITCFCIIGDAYNQQGLTDIFESAHKAGLKTAFFTEAEDVSQINLNIIKHLDFIKLKDQFLMKDYSPFGDVEDWIDIKYK